MSKNISALFAAILVTALLAGSMYYMGNNAVLTIDVIAASTQTAAENQKVLAEFQKRDSTCTSQIKTAASRLASANQKIDQSNLQIKQYQAILDQLQQQGLVAIAPDGTVTITNQPAKP